MLCVCVCVLGFTVSVFLLLNALIYESEEIKYKVTAVNPFMEK